MYGTKPWRSGVGGGWFSRCQCTCGPSPKQETIPRPVIQISREASVMGQCLHRKCDDGCDFLHAGAEVRGGKRDGAKGQFGIAHETTIDFDLRSSDEKTRAFVFDSGADRKLG